MSRLDELKQGIVDIVEKEVTSFTDGQHVRGQRVSAI